MPKVTISEFVTTLHHAANEFARLSKADAEGEDLQAITDDGIRCALETLTTLYRFKQQEEFKT